MWRSVVPIPNMVIALVVGIALNPLAARPAVQPGMNFCVKTLLRWAVALLGLRVALGDIAALGGADRDPDRHIHGGNGGVWFRLRALERAGGRLRRAGRRRHCSVRRLGDARDLDGRAGLQGQAGRHRLRRGGGQCARDAGDAGLPAALHPARLRCADDRRDAGRHDPRRRTGCRRRLRGVGRRSATRQ